MKYFPLVIVFLLSCKSESKIKDAGVIDSASIDVLIQDSSITDANISGDAANNPDAGRVGVLDLMIDVPGFKSNCLPNDANISFMTTRVISNSTNACITERVTHLRTGQLVEEYDTLCPIPTQKLCFERNDKLVIRSIDPGSYHVIVTGFVKGEPCWGGDASVGILPEVTTAQTSGLLHQSDCP